jgi:hypothetical protein
MRMLSGWIRGPWLVALLVASMVLPVTVAEGGKGGRGGGRGGRAPRQAAPRRPSAQAYKMPRASNNAARANVSNNRAANVKTNAGKVNGTSRSIAGNVTGTSATTPHSYSYGSGTNARRYTANGYGHGSRNRSSSRGYGRSQGNSRALVSRLRSVHTSLARLDHDYRGHRANAMHSISNAIRSLSHRSSSMVANGNMNRNNGNNLNGNNGRNRNVANNNNNGQRNRMTQAQSDARMSQALRTTQGIHMQMTNQSSNSSSNGRNVAHRHVLRAISEMHTALAMR